MTFTTSDRRAYADGPAGLDALAPIRTRTVEVDPHGWGRIVVKDETEQISGAFKYRGNSHKVAKLPRGSSLVTASTGNHASGLSQAAAWRGAQLLVFVPRSTPRVKQRKIAGAGARIMLVDGGYHDCERLARRYTAKSGAVFVHSFDDPDVIEGHRSLYRESCDQMGQPDVAFVPIGGGGLVTAAIAEWGASTTRIVGVEYAGAPAMKRSLESARPVWLESAVGMPEGLLVRRVGTLAFQACHAYGLDVRVVDDAALGRAMRILWAQAGIRAEGAGAAALAAALQSPEAGSTCLCVVSGGNVDDAVWRRAVE